eukprot:5470759-Pleurochrysis_carterae.AAC.1
MQHGVHEKLQVDKGDDTALKAIKKEACSLVNFACVTYRVRLEFSTNPKDAMPKINGNAWKEMTKPGFFPDIIDALSLIHQCQNPVRQPPPAIPASSNVPTSAAPPLSDALPSVVPASSNVPASSALSMLDAPPSAVPASSTLPTPAAAPSSTNLPFASAVSPPTQRPASSPRAKRSPYKQDEEQLEQDSRRQKNTPATDLSNHMSAEGGELDDEMEEQGGAQAYLDSLTAELQAAAGAEAGRNADAVPSSSTSHAPAAAMLVTASSSFECRFIDCLQSLLEHWAFVTEKSTVLSADGSVQERAGLRAEAERLGRNVAVSFVSLVGASVRCSYLHAFVYAFPEMIFTLGHILRASMEGFEHGNKVAKQSYLRRSSA